MDTSLASLTPDTRSKFEELVRLAKSRGYSMKVRSTRRTCAEQAELYGIGRTYNLGSPTVTNARGCMSWHTLGRAVDADVTPGTAEAYEEVAQLAESIGMVAGAHFKGFPDLGHYEWHPGVKIEQVCPNPDDCEGGIANSMAMNFGGGGSKTLAWVAAAAGLALVAYAFYLDED